jgi:hypothetical protein
MTTPTTLSLKGFALCPLLDVHVTTELAALSDVPMLLLHRRAGVYLLRPNMTSATNPTAEAPELRLGPSVDAQRASSTIFECRLHALALFLVGLGVPVLSSAAILLLGVHVARRWLRRARVEARFAWRFGILALFAATFYLMSSTYNYMPAAEGAKSFVFLLAAYAAGYSAGRSHAPLSGVVAAAVGAVVFAFLTVAYAGGANFELVERSAPTIWGTGLMLNGPALGALAALGICLLPVAIFRPQPLRPRRFMITLALVALSALGMYTNVAVMNRSPLIALGVAFASGLYVFLTSRSLTWNWRLVKLGILAGIVVAIVTLTPGIFDIKSLQMYQRLDTQGIHTPRYELWMRMLGSLFEAPLGGRYVNLGDEHYAHNLWLDVDYDAGLAPFLALALFHVSHIPAIVRLYRRGRDLTVQLVIGCLGSAMFVTSMSEPVMQMSGSYFLIGGYLIGVVLALDAASPGSRYPPRSQLS